ncbi:MAG: hypothetical protein RSA20_06550, partial [Oscillospiraceae bacterium]
HEAADADTKWSDWVFAVSGILSTKVKEYRGVPAIDATKEVERLVDLIEEKTYSRLPDFPCDCCTACGSTCQTLGIEIMNGRKSRGGKEVQMVPFVRQIVKNTVLSVISELDGYSKDKSIEVTIDGE